ncbi:kinesin-like protein KIN-14N [Wolffia australiana]
MASRNQNRPPSTFLRSPNRKKENMDEGRMDKRRRIVGKMATPVTHNLRSRNILGNVNSGSDAMPAADSISPNSVAEGGMEFNSREDVERLLNERMKGKNKTDKAKCEQQMEYIKKLRACVKWLEGREDGLEEEKLKLQSAIELLEKQSADLAAQMKDKEEQLTAELESMKQKNASLRESLEKEEAEKMSAIDLHNKEVELRKSVENSRDGLSLELGKAQVEAANAEQQIKTLQDINIRLQEYNTSLQQYNSKLQNDAAVSAEAMTKLQKEKTTMTEALSSSRAHCSLLQEQLASSRATQQEALKEKEELKSNVEQLRGELRSIREDRDCQLSNIQSLQSELAKYKEVSGKSSLELATLATMNETLDATCSSQRSQIQLLQCQLDAAIEKLKLSDSTALETIAEFEKQKRTITELQSRLSNAELQIVDAERLRKKLHNTILELKGNIRVFCRVRPLKTDEDDGDESEGSVVSYPSSVELQGRGLELIHNCQTYPFAFDKVFDQGASQEDVFVEISQLVQSALDGYKVCIFAYGQTGSGKTYTMMGKTEELDKKGLIPRSLEQIFQTSQALSSQGWRFKMQASMLEIYNETIRDLLIASKSSGSETSSNAGKQYTIKHDANGNTLVSDLTVVDVCSLKEVSYLLNRAAQSRSVGKTQMNEQSSRSHFVFTLRISGVNEGTEQQVQGVLNLIDLAGSERLAKSGATGDRLKETQAINKSLSALSDVIFAIAKKEDHVPYRNSKLTYLLQPCLGGDAKTLMFVNISPESSSTGESICSLRFAARVNACEIGVPRRQTHQQPRAVDARLSYG